MLAGALVLAAGPGAGLYFGLRELDDEPAVDAPAPEIVIREHEPEAAQDLGFPAFATKNTTRVSGQDPVADAAAVALAVFPSAGGVERPAAISLVEENDWPGGIAAAALAGPPLRAPILLTGTETLPSLTIDALTALAPGGSSLTDDRQVFRIGAAAAPGGLRAFDVEGDSPAELAAAIDELRGELTGERPGHVVLASSDEPAYAMPAAAWAARSGDPVLFMQRESAPRATLEALERHEGVPVYLLGPEPVISDKALAEVREVAPAVTRIGADGPVANAIAFARYVDADFGWDINDPGHGFVIASADRPLDAAAAAPLSASGKWGPLLVTDAAGVVPPELRGYLLDLKPGYQDDPTRALYNHVWLMGDADTISVPFQAQVDDLVELAPVRSGGGALAPSPSQD